MIDLEAMKWQTGIPQKFGRYLCEGFYFNQDSHAPYQYLVEWFDGPWPQHPLVTKDTRWYGPLEDMLALVAWARDAADLIAEFDLQLVVGWEKRKRMIEARNALLQQVGR